MHINVKRDRANRGLGEGVSSNIVRPQEILDICQEFREYRQMTLLP